MLRNRLFEAAVVCAVAAVPASARAQAQELTTVSGRVTSAGGAPLAGASVGIPALDVGAIADASGNYRFTIPGARVTPQPVAVTARVIGYQPQTVQVTLTSGGTATQNFTLTQNPLRLGEVVVTGAGTVSSAERLGTVRTSIDTTAIRRANEPNVLQAIAGKAPGVVVTQQSGEAGASSKVIIRGLNTIQGTGNPLIVVDGSPINNQTLSTSATTASTVSPNRASDLSPEDIESVEVLKSGASAAIYGARAGQGVILITTKKGRSGQARYSLRSTVTSDEVTQLPDLQREFGQGSNGVAASCPAAGCTVTLTGNSWGAPIAAGTPTFDQAGSVFDRGNLLDNALTVSGGNERTQYYLSGTSNYQNGIIAENNDFYRRNTVRLNANQQVVSGLRVGANIQYADVRQGGIQKGSNTSGLTLGAWRSPATFDNTVYIDTVTGLHRSYRYPIPTATSQTRTRGYDNPFFVINQQQNTSDVGRVFGNVNINYDPADWLSVRYTLGSDYTSDERIESQPKTSSNNPEGQVIRANFVNRQVDQNLTASGTHSVGEILDLRATLGTNLNERFFRQNYVTGASLVADQPLVPENTITITPDDYKSRVRGQSYFGQLQATYAEQLTLTGAVRNDGFSTFGRANRRAWFPSAQASWVFTNAVKLGDVISDGKLRAAFGQTGTEPGVYLTTGFYSTAFQGLGGWGDQLYSVQNGRGSLVTADRLAQDSLRPERQNEFEGGIDLGFLQNRADVSFTYYNRVARDVIFDLPVPASSGFGIQAANAGKIRNEGVELSLNLRPIQTADYDVGLGFQFARNKNRVLQLRGSNAVDLPTGGYFTGTYASAVEGHAVGVFRGGDFVRCRYGEESVTVGGVDVNAACQAAGAAEGTLFIGANGFPVDDATLRVIGDPNPDWTGAVRPTFRFRKVNVSGLVDIRRGGDVWNGTKGALYNFGTHGDTRIRGDTVIFGQNYTPGRNDATPVATVGPGAGKPVVIGQTWYTTTGSGFGTTSSQFIEDGSFVKLREIAVGYTLDQPWVRSRLGLTTVDVRVAGRNLQTWTDYTGVDPETNLGGAEVGAQGVDYFNNPQSRSFVFTIGLNR